ncbi:MAG: response regulator [Desulfovibrio sp.]|nr:MAG: response regulator [Desulfovibrio sp.]
MEVAVNGEETIMAAKRKLRVLVADDDAAFRNRLGRMLTKAGHTVATTAGDPAIIWQSIEKAEPDLAVIEYSLAARKDFSLLRRMAAYRATAEAARILVVDAEHEQQARDACPRVSATLLPKEHTPEDLKLALKVALASRGLATGKRSEDAPAVFSSALAKLKAKDFTGAVLGFSRAAKLREIFPEAYKGLGLAFEGQGDMDRALRFFAKAVGQYHLADRPESAFKLEEYVRARFPEAGQGIPPGDHVPGQDQDALGDETMEFLSKSIGLSPQESAESLSVEVEGEDWYCRPAGETKEERETILDTSEDDEDSQEPRQERRKDPRQPLVENFVRLAKRRELYPAVDISSGGIGFKDQGRVFSPGDELVFDVLSMGEEVLMKKVAAQVRHVTKGLVGCCFGELSSRNRKALEQLLGW